MICVSVQEQDFFKCREILRESPMVELRGDLCGFNGQQVGELVQMHPNLLYTHRIAGSTMQKAYTCMVEAIKKGAKYVDVEIEAPVDYLEQIKSYARVNGCALIISYHNYEGTQSLEELQTIYDICRRKGADIVKIVTTAHSTADAARVMQLYKYTRKDNELVADNFMERGEESGSLSNSFGEEQAKLVAFCMGEAGRFTRLLCLELGSPHTYMTQDASSATAPGQYTKEEALRLLTPENYPFRALPKGETIFCENNPKVTVPCSKSVAQRAILAAAFAQGTTVLENFEPCNDILGAVEVVKSLGAEVSVEGSTLTINSGGIASFRGITSIFAGESGLLTRLLVPLAAYLSGRGEEIEISGKGSILGRDLSESVAALDAAGAKCTSSEGHLPFVISGGITENCMEFSGKGSSQIVSGFLMVLPLMEKDSVLKVTEPASIPYLDLTLKVLGHYGVEIYQERALPESITYRIKGGQKYTPAHIRMEPDWSSAANFAVAGALTGGVVLKDMPLATNQADEYILELLESFGYAVSKMANGEMHDIAIGPGMGSSEDTCREMSLHHCPDLFPIAALLACLSCGTTIFEGVGRLSQKESNRAESIYWEFTKLGFDIRIDGDKMYICGSGGVRQGGYTKQFLCSSHNDHRIAMALYVAALAGNMDIRTDNIECMDKSFPSFLERLKK